MTIGSWIIPLALTVVFWIGGYAGAWRVRPKGSNDPLRELAAIVYFGGAAMLSLSVWLFWAVLRLHRMIP